MKLMREVEREIKRTEYGTFPKEWKLVPIKELAKIGTGDKNTEDKVTDGKYPFFVRSANVERINSYSYDGEAVLTAGDGVGTGKIFHYIKGRFDFHQRVYKMSDFTADVNGYYFYLCFSKYFYDRVMGMTAKSSVDSVRMEMIADMKIPLPPTLEEQEAIATALSDVDELIRSLDRLIQKKEAIKKGTMQQLLTGQKRLPGFDGGKEEKVTEVGLIPKDWDFKPLESYCDVRDGTHASPKYQEKGVKFVTSKNIIRGEIDFSDISYISEKDAYEIDKRSKVERNNILMSMIGTIGNSAIVDFEPDFSIKNVALIKPLKIDPVYLSKYLSSEGFKSYLQNKLAGGIQKFVSLGVLRALMIPVPTFEEQKAIAQILSDMDEELQTLRQKRDKIRRVKEGMMQELLTGKVRLV